MGYLAVRVIAAGDDTFRTLSIAHVSRSREGFTFYMVLMSRRTTTSQLGDEELNMTYNPTAGELVEHASFGLGKVVHVTPKRVHIFFRDEPGSAARQFPNPAPVTLASRQTDLILDNTPPFTEEKGRWRIPGNRITFDFALQKFLSRYPMGFEDPAYLGRGDSELNERGYKWDAHEQFVEQLGGGRLEQLVESRDQENLSKTLGRLIIKLPSPYEKMALIDGLKGGDCVDFGAKLIGFLAAPDRQSFDDLAGALDGLPADGTSPYTWPNLTYFPFIAQPDRHMFFKPTPTKLAAEAFGFDLRYQSNPSWAGYQRLIEFADIYLQLLKAHGARDFIDVQSFLWLSPKI